MPELPEVETLRRALQRVLINRRIEQIRVRDRRLRFPIKPQLLRKWIKGNAILETKRRAKYLLCRMENEAHLVIHLGMSGRLLWCDRSRPLDKHDHVRFLFDGEEELRFRDPRRFGLVDVIPPSKMHQYIHFLHLGIEPLSDELTPEALHARCKGLQRPIKNLLMDGTKVVGVGNIYASESLFRAGIHPEKPCGRLKLHEWKKLVACVRETLNLAIANGGTTINDFYNSNGEMGYFQLYMKVYDKEGEPCETCGRRIRRIVQVGRSTYYCPKCQAR